MDEVISETDGSSSVSREDEKIAIIAAAYSEIIKSVGEDTSRSGLLDTPLRAAKAFVKFTEGYQLRVADVVGDGIFDEVVGSEPITVKDIDIYSLCEHHLVPFFGKVHITYIPDKKILGLSKLPRIAEVFARRLQLQERLTRDIAEAVEGIIGARGVGVVIEARHMCMCMRGVEKADVTTVTKCMLGLFQLDPALRAEFMADIHSGRR